MLVELGGNAASINYTTAGTCTVKKTKVKITRSTYCTFQHAPE